MADALFDTTVFIDYWLGHTGAGSLISQVVGRTLNGAVSPISTIELWQFHGLGRREEVEYIALLSFLESAVLDVGLGIEVGTALRPLSRNMRRRLTADAIIALTAKRLGVPVYSGNTRDLSRFYSSVRPY